MVLNDEGHHAYRPPPAEEKLSAEEKKERQEATVWVNGLDTFNQACGVKFCVDLSATPFYIQGSGHPEGSPFPWLVSDFGLVDAIESGITKIPRLPVSDTTGRPEPKFSDCGKQLRMTLHQRTRPPAGGEAPRSRKPSIARQKPHSSRLPASGKNVLNTSKRHRMHKRKRHRS